MASITKTPEGAFRVRYRDGVGRSAPSRSKTFATKRQAAEFKRERESLSAVSVGNASGVSLRTFANAWVNHLRKLAEVPDAGRRELQPTSVETYERDVMRFVRHVGDKPLDRVTVADCKSALTATASAWSVATVKGVRTAARGMFAWAIDRKLIALNPMPQARDYQTAAERNVERKRAAAPSVNELVRMIETAKLGGWKRLIVFGASSGLRRGELAGLRWADIDWQEADLTVNRTVIEYRQDGVRRLEVRDGHAKTGKSLRTFPLASEEIALLRLQRDSIARRAERLGVAFDPDCYCWPRAGEVRWPMGLTEMTTTMRDIRNRAGISARVKPIHGLRHRAARSMLAGAPIEAIAGRLGHSDPRTTSMIYADPETAHLQVAADAAVAGLGDALAATTRPRKISGGAAVEGDTKRVRRRVG